MRIPGHIRVYFAPEGVDGGSLPSSSPSSSDAGSGGAVPAPSSSPSGASATPSAPPPDAGAVDDIFEGMTSLGLEPSEPIVEPPPAAPDAVVPPVATPPTPPVGAEPPKQEPPAPPPAAAPTPQTPPGATSALSPPGPAEPDRLAAMIRENEPALIEALAAEHFRLSAEEVEALNEDMPAGVARLMAKSFLRSQQHLLGQLANIVPALLERHLAVTRVHSEAMDEFFGKFPDLRAHRDEVLKTAQLYRQLHPQTPRAEAIETVGRMMLAMKGITPTAPASPTAPNGRPPASPPFVPARPGVGGTPRTVEVGEFDGLGENYDR